MILSKHSVHRLNAQPKAYKREGGGGDQVKGLHRRKGKFDSNLVKDLQLLSEI